MNETEVEYINECITNMISSGVVEKSVDEPGQFLSSFFTVPKPDGTRRFVLNLNKLNEFLIDEHFKMEDIRTALNLVMPNCFFATMDQKDAYYMVPIHKNYRKFLKFRWKGVLYVYTCLPFGLSLAPWLYTKIMKPVLAFLRSKLIVNVSYLDDLLNIAKTYEDCLKNVSITIQLYNRLGLLINDKKSQLVPSQVIKYLGFFIDSRSMFIYLPDEKKQGIIKKCISIKMKSIVSIQEVAELLGTLVSSCPGVEYGQLYTRKLEMDKIVSLVLSSQSYSAKMTISSEAMDDIDWWLKNVSSSRRKIRTDAYSLTLTTDASPTGWGATIHKQETRGHWNYIESQKHINELELIGIYNGLQALVKLSNTSILIRTDSTTAISYINKYGGCKSINCQIVAKSIWQWCENRQLLIFASYINTKDNFVADALSRIEVDSYDFMLGQKYFYKICNKLEQPEIDLFSTWQTKQCKRFVSWFPNPGAEWIDAFTRPWPSSFYAFPPFKLVTKVLKKIRDEGCRGIVVAPDWPNQPWYPVYQQLIVSRVVYIKPTHDLLFCPYSNRNHPLSTKLTLMAAILSTNHSRT